MGELEDRTIEIIQSKQQKIEPQRLVGLYWKPNIYVTRVPKEEKGEEGLENHLNK
jgi:hypothetical protein